MEANRLEERLKLVKQAIQEQTKGKNTNVEKFELLWDLPNIIEKSPKVRDSIDFRLLLVYNSQIVQL
jgi:hypothetical protein